MEQENKIILIVNIFCKNKAIKSPFLTKYENKFEYGTKKIGLHKQSHKNHNFLDKYLITAFHFALYLRCLHYMKISQI